jgi:hypothetical protein
LFPSEWNVKRAISQARIKGYIRYEITEYTSYGPAYVKPDPTALVWQPTILVLLDEALSKELDEATNQICASSMKQFFRRKQMEITGKKLLMVTMLTTTIAERNNVNC